MSLDMYFSAHKDGEKKEVYYFRKHAVLHDFLLKEWLKQNPDKEAKNFNLQELEITKDFLPTLKEFCESKPQSRTYYDCECFWGRSQAEDWEENPYFIGRIENFLDAGWKVVYVPWW